MNYIGSKQSLSFFIIQSLRECFGPLEQMSFCDLFSGTGAVAHEAGLTCKEIVANDVELYSALWLEQRLCGINDYKDWFEEIEFEKHGFISEHFSSLGSMKRGYFTPQNALKIDGTRAAIENLKPQISPKLYTALLVSLLDASDRVANVASVYGSYLKKLKFTATQDLALRECPSANFKNAKVYNMEGLELLEQIQGDILYLDPPYNHRQYGLNYHVLNAIARGVINSPQGKGGFDGYFRSRWCQRPNVEKELIETIKRAKFKYIAMSYNSEGLLKPSRIKELLTPYGYYGQMQIQHPRLRTQKISPKVNVIEYLHLLEKF
jgi:adenine-specific DNA-methyltransferase